MITYVSWDNKVLCRSDTLHTLQFTFSYKYRKTGIHFHNSVMRKILIEHFQNDKFIIVKIAYIFVFFNIWESHGWENLNSVCRIIGVANVLEELAVSSFRAEDGSNRFLRNIGNLYKSIGRNSTAKSLRFCSLAFITLPCTITGLLSTAWIKQESLLSIKASTKGWHPGVSYEVFVAVLSKSNYCRLWWTGQTRGMASLVTSVISKQQELCDRCM